MALFKIRGPTDSGRSTKSSVSKAVVTCAYTWHRTRRTCYQRKTEGIVGCLRRRDGRWMSSAR